MKKLFLLFILTASLSSNVNSDELHKVTFTCPELIFTLTPSINSVSFSNITIFGIAEMIPDIPLGSTFTKHNTLRAEYHWDYVTSIDIEFPKQVLEFKNGDTTVIKFSFDDGDGVYLDDESLQCSVNIN